MFAVTASNLEALKLNEVSEAQTGGGAGAVIGRLTRTLPVPLEADEICEALDICDAFADSGCLILTATPERLLAPLINF